MSFYGDHALKLVKEMHRTRDPPQIPPYRTDLVRETLVESNHLWTSANLKKTHSAQSMLGVLSVKRSKRCVLAYQRERLNRLIQTWWEHGASTTTVLPQSVHPSPLEDKFMKGYLQLVTDYKGKWLDIDLGAPLLPPRDVFAEIRVLKDCGERMTEYGPIQVH
ncbi:hypothetical protein EDD86DRAFT_212297 [Gorgonomyces haynaldii]|nr:hypothetical protein EDD86DRAFT_212297 [Gorgonomyces haynaldii]